MFARVRAPRCLAPLYDTMFAFTPIFAQSAWIISAIRRAFRLYARCTGIAHSAISNPFGMPAFRKKLLRFGSCSAS